MSSIASDLSFNVDALGPAKNPKKFATSIYDANDIPKPQVFRDDLELRARNIRFRGIGNPFNFLDELGILPIKEFIFRGNTIIDLADTINLPVAVIREWVERNGYAADLEDAAVVSAEGYLTTAQRMVSEATTDFDLKKAKLAIEHARFMASKKDKKVYGGQLDPTAGPAAVSYTFVINASEQNNAGNLTTVSPVRDPVVLDNEDKKRVEFTLPHSMDTPNSASEEEQNSESMLAQLPSHLRINTVRTGIKPVKCVEAVAEKVQTKETKSEKDRWDF